MIASRTACAFAAGLAGEGAAVAPAFSPDRFTGVAA